MCTPTSQSFGKPQSMLTFALFSIDTLLDDSFPLSQLPSLRIVSAGSQPQSQSSSSAHALARRVRVDPQSTLGQPQMSPPAVSQTGLKPDKAPPSQSGQPSNAGLEEHIQTPLLEAQDGRDANRAGNAEQPGEADSGDQLLDMLHSGSSAIDREAWSRGVAVSLVDQETGQAISLQASDVLVAPVECTVPRLGSNARSSDAATAVNSGALVRESSATSSRDARVPNASAHLQSHGQHHLASSDGDTDFAVTDKRSGRTSNNGINGTGTGTSSNNSTGTSSITVPTAGAARQMPARGGIVSNFDSIMESLSTRIRPDERGGDADMDALPRRSRIQPQQADQGQASSSRQARKRKASGPDEAGNRRLDGFLAPAPHVASAKRRAMAIRTLLVDSQCANLPLNDLRGRYAALLAKRSADARKASQDRLSVQHDGFASVGVVAQPSHDLAGAACVVVCHRSALWLVNPQRVQETVLYHALTSGYAISSDPLPSPVPLTAAQVGGPHILQYLRSLPRDPANGAVKDNRLEANGFRLAFPDGGASLSSAPVLQGLATKIGSLDVADLRELLAGMYRHDQDLIQGSPAGSAAASDTSQGRGKASLSLFRPSKALRLFRDQARQLTRKRIEKNEANGSVVDDTVLACDRLLRHKQRQQRSADKPCSPAAVSSVEPIATLECTWQCPHGHAIAASLGPALRSTGPS
ncbi:hypothetical protein BC831DRAFT_106457 [Entophlyctis helioformis]|nr:hypothetical protein BC831DRAFT_106457 [Entophlyctis helioformis]